jgi:hypothetical protein
MSRLLIASLLVLTLTGCGSDEPQTSADQNCIVTFAGNKLCGSDGRAWCEKFANRLDADTRSACRSVGASFGREVDDSDPSAIALAVSNSLDERFSELQPTADFTDGRYEVTLADFDGTRVPKRTLKRACQIASDAANVQRTKVAVMDVNSPADFVSCAKLSDRR